MLLLILVLPISKVKKKEYQSMAHIFVGTSLPPQAEISLNFTARTGTNTRYSGILQVATDG
jgi:hypothetical protein